MKKKLALFTNQLPGLQSGTPVRNYHMLEGLKTHFDVTIYSFLDEKADEKKVKKDIHENTYFFYLPAQSIPRRLADFAQGKVPYIERLKRSLQNSTHFSVDPATTICLFQELHSYFVLSNVFDTLPGKKILDTHNIEFVKVKGEISSQSPIMQLLGKRVIPQVKTEEQIAVKRFDYVFTCSKKDREYFVPFLSPATVSIIPNGVDCDYFTPAKGIKKHSILFMGLLSYQPNNDALHFFIHEVFPAILELFPDSQLVITGKDPQPWLVEKAKETNSILLRGFVADVRKVIAQAEVCICPLRYGSGTRLKILEYMAMAKPIISTGIGAEGIDVTDGKNICLANSVGEFVQKIKFVFSQPEKGEGLGLHARALVERNYQWKHIQQKLINTLQKVV